MRTPVSPPGFTRAAAAIVPVPCPDLSSVSSATATSYPAVGLAPRRPPPTKYTGVSVTIEMVRPAAASTWRAQRITNDCPAASTEPARGAERFEEAGIAAELQRVGHRVARALR